jgi:DNA invertase Pin-like site-specific DNA recombinase
VTRAVGYVRLSKIEDNTTSPQRQREAIEQLCKARGWELVDLYQDIDVSAYNGRRRPGLERMLARIGDVDAVVFMRLDRLARSVIDFHRIKEQCSQANVQLVSADLQIDTASPVGQAMETIVAAFAQLESDTLAKRSREAAAYNKSQGVWVGQVPFGWRREGKGLVPVPEQQAVIEAAARRYVAGESLRSIAPSTGMTHPNLARILRSERVLEALPDDLAGRLAVELAGRGRTGTSATPSLLGGIARCAVCDGAMTVVAQKRRHRSEPRGAYACRERGHVSISRRWLDRHVSDAVLEAAEAGGLAERVAKRRRPVPKVMKAPAIEARLEMLERDFYELERFSRESFLRRRDALLQRLEAARAAEEQETGPDLPLELARRLPETWPHLTTAEQRQIVRALVAEIRVSKANGTGIIDPNRVSTAWR